ncbi:helix-turn-helix transcriptional regulator [Chitinophaga filiformis]|uniref:helix-turn-helix domain-containing protein n=1 Tax=Chitinophaga filiformis TaxID=104663 RepID=UPI001F39E8B2|nr:AraC family transcriptional regulator [Chitinophaga filiformis]MCF6406410.1 helix-turn-helix transcriptional regulator [Chitinophaga filiformis]
MKNIETLEDFYKKKLNCIPDNILSSLGHFNVFRLEDFGGPIENRCSPYTRKSYYKISMIIGKNKYEYADKTVDIRKNALLFSSPHIPYRWTPLDEDQKGFICIFTESFFSRFTSIRLNDYPVFKPGGQPVYFLNTAQLKKISSIFSRMLEEIASDYAFKYEVLRNYVFELIHEALKMEPASTLYTAADASSRISSQFAELLERQFPIESPGQRIHFRSASDFADQLSVHVNHLNKALKETTGKSTSTLIGDRILQESLSLLKYTDWNVSQIAYSLGFEAPTHFNNFFKKKTNQNPSQYRVI